MNFSFELMLVPVFNSWGRYALLSLGYSNPHITRDIQFRHRLELHAIFSETK
jgi:hypothetical protein